MPKLIALGRIVTSRPDKGGVLRKTIIMPGELFDFTDSEVESLSGKTPAMLRRPINESAPVDSAPEAPAAAARATRGRGAAANRGDPTGL